MDNMFVFIFISLINSFAFTSAMTNLLLTPPSTINRVFVYIYIALCQIFFGQYLGQNIIYFTIGGALLIIAASSKKYISNIIFSLLGYLLAIVTNYVMVALLAIMGTTVTMIYSNNLHLILFVSLYCILTFIVTYSLGKYIRKYLVKDIPYFPKQIKFLCILEVALCAIVFAYHIIEAEKNGYSSIAVSYNTVIFGSFFAITLVIFLICLRIMQKNHILQEMEKQNEYLNNYAMKLEDLYQYMNNNQSQGFKNDSNISKLEHIKLLEIKGILYSKLVLAINLKLNIIFEINDDIDDISMGMLDLAIIVDEIMKNAIESAVETEEKEIIVVLKKNNGYISFIVSNSSPDTNINLETIYDEGMTSKRNHLGNGLFIIRQHLNKYNNIIHTTTFNNKIFTQKLEI